MCVCVHVKYFRDNKSVLSVSYCFLLRMVGPRKKTPVCLCSQIPCLTETLATELEITKTRPLV